MSKIFKWLYKILIVGFVILAYILALPFLCIKSLIQFLFSYKGKVFFLDDVNEENDGSLFEWIVVLLMFPLFVLTFPYYEITKRISNE